MRMYSHSRHSDSVAGSRKPHSFSWLAVIATAALIFGPGALAAHAEDAPPPADNSVTQVDSSTTATRGEASAVESAPVEAISSESTPVESTPAQSTPPEAAATESAPAESIPAEPIAVESAPVAPLSAMTSNDDDSPYCPEVMGPQSFNNDDDWDECNPPSPPAVSVSIPACVPYGLDLPTAVPVTVSGLKVGATYTATMARTGWSFSASQVAPVASLTLPIPVNGLGDYTVTVTGPHQESGSAHFSIVRCIPPDTRDSVSICHADSYVPEFVATLSPTEFIKLTIQESEAYFDHAGVDPLDIIPPFDFVSDGVPYMFTGQNWDEYGQELLRNNCLQTVPEVPAPEVTVTVNQCHGPGGVVPTSVLVKASALEVEDNYTLRVTGPAGLDESTPFTATAAAMEFTQAISGPGEYVATVTSGSEEPLVGEAAFTVNPKCATPPVTPPAANPTPPALVNTGTSSAGTAGPATPVAAAILLAIGGGALLAASARRARRSDR